MKQRKRHTNMMCITISTLALCTLIALAGCATRFAGDPLDTVDALDVERYLGRWYEIARFQLAFEKNIMGATAEYSLKENGRVAVLNSGFKKTLDGPYTAVKAEAWRPDDGIQGALKVKFFGLFTSDYLVFGLDQDYQWALVGNNARTALWFLSRTPEISDEILQQMKDIAIAQGYDLSGLFLVPQKQR